MLASLVVVAQAALPATPPLTIDLLAPIRPLRCPELQAGDIVICGVREGDDQRVFRREPDEHTPLKAEMRLSGNTRGAIETEGVDLPGIGRSNRLMFRCKMPF